MRLGAADIAGANAAGKSAFAAEVEPVVRRLRGALHALIVSLPQPVRRGPDLQRQLGIANTMAWKIHSFVESTELLTAAAQLPGREAVRRMLDAATAKGVRPQITSEVAEAFDAFEACGVRHAGSRALFALMLNSQGDKEPSALALEARRAAFRALSYLYGVQMAISARCFFLHPGASPDHYDLVLINSSIGLQVNRPFEKLCIGRFGHEIVADPDAARAPARPIVETSLGARLHDGVPLLTDFCSSPLPRFTVEAKPKSYHEVSVSGQPIGRTGAATFHIAERWPDAAPREEELGFESMVQHPTEVVFHDVLLAPGIAQQKKPPLTGVFGGPYHEIRQLRREVDRLDVHAQSAFMGTGVDALQTMEMPRHVEMLRFVCSKLGWNPDTFDVYRCRIEFPVLHSLLDVTFPRLDTPVG